MAVACFLKRRSPVDSLDGMFTVINRNLYT